MFTNEQVQEMLEAAKPSMIEGLKQQLSQSITYEMREAFTKNIREHVTVWMQENVLPEITAQLVESKDGLIAVGVDLGQGLNKLMVDALLEDFKKNLESSYKRKTIYEAMFKN